MKFLSDILAKAGLTVDGVVTLNNTATGQTPAANDNSTKLATTAWVRGFVTPYTLPIASGTTLGGIKIGSGLSIDGTGIVSVAASGVGAIRSLQQITATAGQTVFTVSGGYTPGLIDVFLNGVLLTPTTIDASSGSTFTLADASVADDLLDIFVYNPIYNGFISSTDQVPEGTTNLYYTNTRARAAISLTTNGVNGASTYNSATGVLNIPNYQSTPPGGNAGDILAKNSATDYDVVWIPNYTSQVQHSVKLAQAMTIGTPVYVSGSTGQAGTNMLVSKASNASEGTSSKTLGLIAFSGVTNDIGFVITEGLLSGLDTSSAGAVGDPVWLGPNGTLIYGLLNKPYAPDHLVFIGIVTRKQQNNGEIFVKVQNGYELDELHNLSVKDAADGDMIKYVASTGLWTKIAATTTNITEGTNLYYTDARVNTYLTANNYATQSYVGTAIANLIDSAPTTLDTLNELAAALGDDPNFATTIAASIGGKLSLTGGTLTGALGIATNGNTLSINSDGLTIVNSTWGTVYGKFIKNSTAIDIWASGPSTAGLLALSLDPYHGTSTFSTSVTATSFIKSGGTSSQFLKADGSIDSNTYITGITSSNVTTALGYTPVTNARTITINGTTYDLSADRSWTIASGVTSFNTRTGAITPATGDYTTAQVTESGSLYFTTARARTSISLTTTGTSGAATYDSATGILNIPTYQGGVTSFNTRTGAITLSSTDVTDALGFTPASSVSSSSRTIQTYTATANQTTFTVTGGYVVGLVDVYINGIKLSTSDFTATNGSTVVLATGTGSGNIVEVVRYNTAFTATNALRQITEFTATAGQTTFSVTYNPGLVDVFYNGSKLASSDYTATNGTSVVLGFSAVLNDAIEVVAYSYAVGAYTGQAQLNGTGFVKVSGTTVSYDDSTYLTTSAASSTYVPYTGATANLNLGSNNLTSNNVYVNGDPFNYSGGALRFRQEVAAPAGQSGHNSISAQSSGHHFSSSQGGSFKNFLFDPSSLTDVTLRSYTMPNASGTLALTSDLSSYLPLSGGTLTGSLSGTSATFSGFVGIGASASYNLDVVSASDASLFQVKSTATANNTALRIGIDANTSFINATGSSTGILELRTYGTPKLTIQATGAATFLSSVTANATSGNSYLSFRSQYDTDSNYRLDLTQVVSAGLVKHSFNVVNAGTAYNNTLVLDRGNVGIGTSSPNVKFEVLDTATSSGEVARFQRNIDTINEYAYIKVGSEAYPAYFGSMLGTYDVAYMSMFADPTTGRGIYIRTVDGYVGIGTYAPQQLLHIYNTIAAKSATITIENTINAYNADIRFTSIFNGGTSKSYLLGSNINVGGGSLEVYDASSNATRAFFGATGNFIVGGSTTDGGYKFEVRYSTYNRIASYFSGSYTSGWSFSDLLAGIVHDAGVDKLSIFSNAPGGNIVLTTNSQDRIAISSNGGMVNYGERYAIYTKTLMTPNGGSQNCRIIEDALGQWVLVGKFIANAAQAIQGVWSSVRGLSVSTSQSDATAFSADWGDSLPTEVRVLGATDFDRWRETRTIDFIYRVPTGRTWATFFNGGNPDGTFHTTGTDRYGFTTNGTYDGFGRWNNPSNTQIGMSDGAYTNPSSAYTTPTSSAFNWNTTQDAKLTAIHSLLYSGQDVTETTGFGVDDGIRGFFDTFPNLTSNMQTGDVYSSAVWILIKLN